MAQAASLSIQRPSGADRNELIVDLFAGGGGASTAILMATGRHPDVAVNHAPDAVGQHAANHPHTRHYCCDVFEVDPVAACSDTHGNLQPVGLLWASPDCTHHSKARGGKPADKKIRALAWVVVRWAAKVRPRCIFLENVEEFQDWGPLGDDNRPIKSRRGEIFRNWVGQLEALGYRVEWRELVAADYGAPTTRKRLFLVARRDGLPIVWPEPTHAPRASLRSPGLFDAPREPWRMAADIIDWNLPCPSIFGRKKDLAPKTMKRIAKGIRKFVIEAAEPFIVPAGSNVGACGADEGLAAAHLTKFSENSTGTNPKEPLHTAMAGAPRHGVVTAMLGRQFGTAVGRDVREPHPTVMTDGAGGKSYVAAACLTSYYGHGDGADLSEPSPTVVTKDRHAPVVAFMEQANTGVVGHDASEPVSTILAAGSHQRPVTLALESLEGARGSRRAQVLAFLRAEFGEPTEAERADPLGSAQARLRFGLVIIGGEVWQITDIGMRMLTPRELYGAQGFPDDYIIDRTADGRALTKTAQTRMAGNSVSPPPAAALIAANDPLRALKAAA
ncbi:DNA cytosine methyltransferase [Brevundimonas diminuta]|uniref:DNA cytosine methyltransferase n=1 Tax=Brevundimonas diminuta TaxID=293 RepID=UPI003D9A8148